MQTAAGMCASSNWSSVRTSTTSAPSRSACWTWRGVSGWASTVSATSGPRLSATMFSKLGGCGRSAEVACANEVVLVVDLEQRLVRALEADRGRGLQVHARPAAERAAEVARPHLARVRQRHQRVVQRLEDPAGALGLVHGEVGARDVAHEQAVAGEDGPRLVAAGRVDEREGGVLGPVARRVHRTHRDRAEPELPAVVEGLVLVVRARPRGARGSWRPSRPRAARGPRRGRRGCASRGCARCGRRGSARAAGTRRCRASGPPPRRGPRSRRRSGSWHSRGRRGRACRKITRLGARLGPDLGLDLGRALGGAALAGQLEGRAHEVAEQRLRAQRARLELGVVLGRHEEGMVG